MSASEPMIGSARASRCSKPDSHGIHPLRSGHISCTTRNGFRGVERGGRCEEVPVGIDVDGEQRRTLLAVEQSEEERTHRRLHAGLEQLDHEADDASSIRRRLPEHHDLGEAVGRLETDRVRVRRAGWIEVRRARRWVRAPTRSSRPSMRPCRGAPSSGRASGRRSPGPHCHARLCPSCCVPPLAHNATDGTGRHSPLHRRGAHARRRGPQARSSSPRLPQPSTARGGRPLVAAPPSRVDRRRSPPRSAMGGGGVRHGRGRRGRERLVDGRCRPCAGGVVASHGRARRGRDPGGVRPSRLDTQPAKRFVAATIAAWTSSSLAPCPASPDEHELRARPSLGEPPRDVGRAADVEASVHEHTGNAVESLRVAHQRPILEERGIAPVVGHQSGEREPEARVVVTVVVDMAGMGGDVGVLPLAPPQRPQARAPPDRGLAAGGRRPQPGCRHARPVARRRGTAPTPRGRHDPSTASPIPPRPPWSSRRSRGSSR